MRKLLGEFASGHVTEALLMVPSRADTKSGSLLRDMPRRYLAGRKDSCRVRHARGEEEKGGDVGSALFYLGPAPTVSPTSSGGGRTASATSSSER